MESLEKHAATSPAELATTLQRLRGELGIHQRALAAIETRRARSAFDAANGDLEARSQIARIERDEATARSGEKNASLAIAECVRRQDASLEAIENKRQAEREQRLDHLGANLLATDEKIVEAAQTLRRLLDGRSAIASDIVALDILPRINAKVLASTDGVNEMLAATLRPHFGGLLRGNHYSIDSNDIAKLPAWSRRFLGRAA